MYRKYYDSKVKEFHDHKLGKLTMDEYVRRFLELLRYVPYIKDEKVRIQFFLSGLPQSFQDQLSLMNLRPLMTPSERPSIL
jgi:hypothetical protein